MGARSFYHNGGCCYLGSIAVLKGINIKLRQITLSVQVMSELKMAEARTAGGNKYFTFCFFSTNKCIFLDRAQLPGVVG